VLLSYFVEPVLLFAYTPQGLKQGLYPLQSSLFAQAFAINIRSNFAWVSIFFNLKAAHLSLIPFDEK